MSNILCRAIFSLWWKTYLVLLTKWYLRHLWSEEQKGILNFLMRRKWSEGLQAGSFQKLLEEEELKQRTCAKWGKGNGFFNTALETKSPFCFSGMIKPKQGKSCHTDYSPCLGDNNDSNTCALRRFPTLWYFQLYKSLPIPLHPPVTFLPERTLSFLSCFLSNERKLGGNKLWILSRLGHTAELPQNTPDPSGGLQLALFQIV